MPTKHMGAIDSDAVVGRYLDQVERLPQRYAIRVESKVTWPRRLLRWTVEWVRKLFS